MSSPVWRTTSSELPNRRTSPSSAQIATEVTAPMPKWAARSAAHPGCRRDSMSSCRRSGSSSAVSRSICRSPVSTACRPAGDKNACSAAARPSGLATETAAGTPWWNKVAATRWCHPPRSSTRSLYSRAVARASSTCCGGIQHSGRSPAIRCTRRCRVSVLSVLACRFLPRSAAVSAGSARCGVIPAA